MSRPFPSRPPWTLAGAFFLSGAAALVYELLWFRLLAHVMGSTATATATLLAAYLFGLGLGAWIFGKLADRTSLRAGILYVGAECGIGLYGLACKALFATGATLYALVHGWAADSHAGLFAGRFVVSFVLIAIPTTLMGGTFPLMVRLLREGGREMGRAAGSAYAVNTAGAALGTLALPFVLLPWLGVTWALVAAALANGAAALLVHLGTRGAPSGSIDGTSREVGAPASPAAIAPLGAAPFASAALGAAPSATAATMSAASTAAAPTPGLPRPIPRGSVAALLAAFFLSSFAALGLETVWTRHLGIFFGTKIHIFAFVLFAYLIGLFLGGSLYAHFSARGADPARLLHGGLFAAALGAAIPIPLLDRISLPQVELMIRAGVTHASFLMTTGIVIVALVIVPATGFGVVFPAVVDLLFRAGRRTGSSVGTAYVVNTIGTSLGAPVAGFLLVPRLGSQATLELCAVLVAAALALAPGSSRGRGGRWRPLWRYAVAASFLLLFQLPRWDWKLAHSQYVKDPPTFVKRYEDGTLWPIVVSYDIEYLAEGAEATVSVCKFGNGSRSLYVNGKADASNILADMVQQRLVGIVPALFHPAPKRALVIGVGSGTTVAMLHRFGIPHIDAAEISPEVATAARLYFDPINEKVLDEPEVTLHLDDGRNFLHFQPPATYDIIVSEPSNPWMAGVSALFTDEFFADVEARLAPGGVACQWFHLYSMSPEHVRLLVRTFQRRFPQCALFLTRSRRFEGDMILIGSKGPLRMARLPEADTVPARIRLALSEILNAGNAGILSGFAGGPDETATYSGEGAINSDDHPILELEAPGDLFDRRLPETIATLVGTHRELFLAAGPAPAESSTRVELARDGFAAAPDAALGRESRRGAIILTKLPAAADPLRWVLLGRTLEGAGGAATDALWLARPLGIDDELDEIVTVLAGPGGATLETTVKVNGHDMAVARARGSDSASDPSGIHPPGRTIVAGWACPARRRGYFLRERVPAGDERSDEAVAADLVRRLPCDHAPR